MSFPSDNIFTLITANTNTNFENFTYVIDMDALGISTLSANNDIIVNIGFSTRYQNVANNTCVVIDEVELTSVDDLVPDTQFDFYVNNMTTFTGAPCHGQGSSNCGTPDGLGFTAGTHTFSTSRRGDGVLLARSTLTTTVSVSSFAAIDIDYLDGQRLRIPNFAVNTSNCGKDPNDGGSGTGCTLEYIFPMPNATWIDRILINAGGAGMDWEFQPRQLDDGTTTDSVNQNKAWMDIRLNQFNSLTDDGEIQNGVSGWLDGLSVPLINLYPTIMRNFLLDLTTGILSFDVHTFGYNQDGTITPTISVTFTINDGVTDNLLSATTQTVAFTANQQDTSETVGGFFGFDLGDKFSITWDAPENADYVETGLPQYNGTMEVNFTLTPDIIVLPSCAFQQCVDFDNDGNEDDLTSNVLLTTGICQKITVINDATCVAITGGDVSGNVTATLDSVEGPIEDAIGIVSGIFNIFKGNTGTGGIFFLWLIISIAMAALAVTQNMPGNMAVVVFLTTLVIGIPLGAVPIALGVLLFVVAGVFAFKFFNGGDEGGG